MTILEGPITTCRQELSRPDYQPDLVAVLYTELNYAQEAALYDGPLRLS
ncbi:MAG TPA: hypothetical protein VLH38_03710 [Patescibacteria group bacterium]|nr:hypothetical protein [Patescibacteria group bacterium]